MTKIFTIIILIFLVGPARSQFFLGYDFGEHFLDGRYVFSEITYAGFKVDPGINTEGKGDDVKTDLDLFARLNLLRPTAGFALGPEVAWRVIRDNDLDKMLLYFNFSADLAINIGGPIYIYGHVPLIGFEVIAYDNDNGNNKNDNVSLVSFDSGFPSELGFMFEF